METICLIIIVAVFILQIKGETDEKQCQVQTNVIPSDINDYLQFKLPDSREGKCYGACVLKSMSIIDSRGKINLRNIDEVARNFIKSQEQLGRVESAIRRCSRPANHLKDECETAYYFMKCLEAMNSNKLMKSGHLVTITLPSITIELPPVTFVLFQFSVI